MPAIATDDGVKLHYEEAGSGTPVVFVHEFAGDHRSWEPQMRFFARTFRCIAYSARGFPPSDVPEDGARYSQVHARDDVIAVLDHLKIERAHVVGLSMGGFAALHVGIAYPRRARSLVIAGCGYGAEPDKKEKFQAECEAAAASFESNWSETAKKYALGPTRVQFQNKDPRGWREFADRLATHSDIGAAMTMRGVQARRPSFYDLEAGLKAMAVPTLVMVGDEDDHCLQPGIFLKKTIPACGLIVFPKTGHTLNLEEPTFFNDVLAKFLAQVETGRWTPRDPRAMPGQIMRTK
jgi:pimeloyl-ACP methyl ester carboxylesterase